jgi:hypothetical protein
MSAYIVGHDHIDALLTFATRRDRFGPVSYLPASGNRVEITSYNATEIGRILLTENERSVRHRYPGDAPGDLPGTSGEDAARYSFRPWQPQSPPAVAILKGCDCFDYQACETDDYDTSLAARIIEAIRKRAIHRLTDYENAPGWEFRRPPPRDTAQSPRAAIG